MLVSVLAVALGGCSADGDEDEGAASTTKATPPTTAGRDLEADLALAVAALLTLDDLPAGWREDPGAETDPDNDAAFERLCGDLVEERDVIREAAGGDPVEAEAAFVGAEEGLPAARDSVTVFPEPGLAGLAFALATSEPYERCLAQAFADPESRPDPAVVYGDPETSVLSLASAGAVGDDIDGVRISAPVISAGAGFVVHLDVVTLRVDRVLHQMLFASADLLPLDTAVRDAALVAAADFDATDSG